MPSPARSFSRITLAALLAAAPMASPAAAQTAVYEPFDSPAGQALGGLAGGSGWAGPWTDGGSGPCAIGAGTLTLSSLAVLGNRSSIPGPSAWLSRPLTQPVGQDGTTIFLSFLLRPIANVAGVNAWGGFDLGPSAGTERLFVGKTGTYLQYAIETAGGTGISPSLIPAVEGQTALLVVRIVFGTGPDRIDLWVNPPTGAAAPTLSDATKTDLDLAGSDSIHLNCGDSLTLDLDELRIGPTYASVTPQACYANCDQSTQPPILNVTDFFCFLNGFATADPYANCDHSTTPPVLNILDFTCFLNAFASGCP